MLVCFWGVLFICIEISDRYTPNYYHYIESVEGKSKRFSLYEWVLQYSMFVIFEHKIDYHDYKKVEETKISLEVFNQNPHDTFIYYFYPEGNENKNPKIEIIKDKYLVVSIDGLYNFLHNLETWEKYSKQELIDKSVTGQITKIWEHPKNAGLQLWKQEIHNEIAKIVDN